MSVWEAPSAVARVIAAPHSEVYARIISLSQFPFKAAPRRFASQSGKDRCCTASIGGAFSSAISTGSNPAYPFSLQMTPLFSTRDRTRAMEHLKATCNGKSPCLLRQVIYCTEVLAEGAVALCTTFTERIPLAQCSTAR